MVQVKNIFKSFSGIEVLKDVSFSISSPQIVGLAGPSGSGKSTLLRCLQGLEVLDSGVCVVPERVGFVFQDFQLFPHMSVLKNLTYAPSLHKKNLLSIQDQASYLLRKLDMNLKGDVFPGQLSGGEKQRVALARALMMEPSLLLCDEPTSGLDVKRIREVEKVLRKVQKENVIIIIASHDLPFLVTIADRVLCFNHGRIMQDLLLSACTNPLAELHDFYQMHPEDDK